jgi:hypothetical protein
LAQVRPYWPHLACILVLDFAAVPLALLVPVPIKIAIDSAIGEHPLPWPLGRSKGSAAKGPRSPSRSACWWDSPCSPRRRNT